jgi:hypothetical protein
MMVLDADAILALYAGVPLAITAVMAVYCNLCSLHRSTRSRESIYECSHCGHVYAIARNRPMDRCPRCGELNEAVRT